MTLDEARNRLFDTGFLFGGLRRRRAVDILVTATDPVGIEVLAQALKQDHSRPDEILQGLGRLSPETDAAKVQVLWAAFAKDPKPALAGLLARLGWPPEQPIPGKLASEVLAAATAGADPQVLQVVAAFARALPVADEAVNDAIYAAWVRTQSRELERLIAEQTRQPATPAFEALYALVRGDLAGYAALDDADGSLLAQAFAMAPAPLRVRLAQGVAASRDLGIKAAYRRAIAGGALDRAQGLESLALVGDEDGLFEQVRHLELLETLDLCERWFGTPGRPSHAVQRAAVDRAVDAYRSLGTFQVEPGPELPDGLVDIFDHWRSERPSDAELCADLGADDPFRKVRGHYLGYERGLVGASSLAGAAESDHWPERLTARLLGFGAETRAGEDPVLWVESCGGDSSLLHAPVGGSPEDYACHRAALERTSGPVASRAKALRGILCAFQGVFVAGGITVDETSEAADRRAVEIEDAGDLELQAWCPYRGSADQSSNSGVTDDDDRLP